MKMSLMNMRKQVDGWHEAGRHRRELREHGAAICKDIGVSRATLDFEGKRLPWKKNTETPETSSGPEISCRSI